jgi:hypothetical protein
VLNRRLTTKTNTSIGAMQRGGGDKNPHQQLELDLAAIMGASEEERAKKNEKKLGNYCQIAPSPEWDGVLKLKRQLFSK